MTNTSRTTWTSWAWWTWGAIIFTTIAVLSGCASAVEEGPDGDEAPPAAASSPEVPSAAASSPAETSSADETAAREPFVPVDGGSWLDSWQPSPIASPQTSAGQDLPKKWMVFGWDGAWWDIILPLVEAGRMPNFESVMRSGVYGNMQTIQPTESPVLWTTVATGMAPSEHGIDGWVKTEQGKRRLYLNADRRVKAVWNILSELDKRVLVVGYHNTYPAEPVLGQMISNFLVYRNVAQRRLRSTPDMDAVYSRAVYPSTATPETVAFDRTLDSLTYEEMSRFANLTKERFQTEMTALAGGKGDPALRVLRRAYLFDQINAELALHFYPKAQPDLMMLHFQGADWSAHKFLYFHSPERFENIVEKDAEVLESQLPTYAGTVSAFYEHLDEWLGRFLELADEDTGVMVLSDHGFMIGHASVRRSGYHGTAPPGIFVASGPGIRHDTRIDGATIYDVLPTLFAAMGLDVAKDWRGQPLGQIFANPTHAEQITYRDSYHTGDFSVPQVDIPEELNEELLDQLRSLGYIR